MVNAQERPVYVLAGLSNYPPYSYSEAGSIRGIDVDVAKEAYHRAGLEVEFVLLPWKRLLDSARRGTVDGTLGAFITEEREAYLDYIDEVPLRWIQMSLFTYKSSTLKNSDLNDLRNRSIGVNRGFAINVEFDQAAQKKDFNLVPGNDISQLLKMLSMQRLDGVVHSKGPALYYIHKLGLTNLILIKRPVTEKRGGFMSLSRAIESEERLGVKAKLQKAMQEMLADGTLDKIWLKHEAALKTEAAQM
jgi:polar amino acid transport system substrate-binding protein